MSKKCIKIRRRGFNFDIDFMGKYFETALSPMGLHLVFEEEQADQVFTVYFDDSPWMTMTSELIDEMPNDRLQQFSEELAGAFKAAVQIEPFAPTEYMQEMQWFFSTRFSAFDIEPFIREGDPRLEIRMVTGNCVDGVPFQLSCQNYGGVTMGLEVYICGSFAEGDTAIFDEFALMVCDYDGPGKKELTFTAEPVKCQLSDQRWACFYDFPDFAIPEGVNLSSAKLCGKSRWDKYHDRMIHLRFIPRGSEEELQTIHIYIIPKCIGESGVIWKSGK